MGNKKDKRARRLKRESFDQVECSLLAFKAAYGTWLPGDSVEVAYGATGQITFWRILNREERYDVQVVMLWGKEVVERIELGKAFDTLGAALSYTKNLDLLAIM